jgi:xanthine dehydrogenase small subunit
MPLENFFLRYGVQDRAPGEFVESLHSAPGPRTLIRIVKLSKRFDSDISAVCGAFCLTIAGGRHAGADRVRRHGRHSRARAAGRSRADRPALACRNEHRGGGQALARDYAPLSDLRGSSAYRVTVAANLLRRLWIQQASGEP